MTGGGLNPGPPPVPNQPSYDKMSFRLNRKNASPVVPAIHAAEAISPLTTGPQSTGERSRLNHSLK